MRTLYSWFCEACRVAPVDMNPGDKFILVLFPLAVLVSIALAVEVILLLADSFT